VETPVATMQAGGLRGPARRRYEAFLDDLAAQGCAAMGYRLSGPDPLPRLCVQHLRAQDRVVVAFPAVDEAWILLVAPHRNDDPGRNVYDLLYQLAGWRHPSRHGAPNHRAATSRPARHRRSRSTSSTRSWTAHGGW